MLISIVIPAYNESEGVEIFHTKHLITALKKIKNTTFEIVYVNDGSQDNTLDILASIAGRDDRVKIINLSRNFGKEIAVTAGISVSTGDATIIMDSDGQHPPELISEFLEKWNNGAQVVVGVRKSNTKEGFIKRWGSKAFYSLFNSTSNSEIIPRSTDFRLIDKYVRAEFLRFSERHRITRGLIDWLGFKRDYVYFDAPERIAGEASYKFNQLVRLALNSFVSLSLKPLFIFGWIGVLITSLSLLAGTFLLVEQVFLNDPLRLGVTGAVLLGIMTSFLIGIVLISQGVIAIYLSHVHSQTQDRPLFVIDKSSSINLKE